MDNQDARKDLVPRSIARRLAVGCLLPAALTPKADWHERWKHITAAAGAIAAISCLGSEDPDHAEDLVQQTEEAFRLLCMEISTAANDPRDVQYIWDQHGELIDGLRKRVAERLSLLTADQSAAAVQAVTTMLAAIAKRRLA